METVTSADGTPIAFERTGSGPSLLIVHGSTADHTRWEPIRPALADHFTVYAMDRRGRGDSGDAREYALEREFEDVAAVVGSIGEPVHLLGHSSGAIVALEAVLRLDDLDALVLYEPPLPVSDLDPDSEEVLAGMETLIETGDVSSRNCLHHRRDRTNHRGGRGNRLRSSALSVEISSNRSYPLRERRTDAGAGSDEFGVLARSSTGGFHHSGRIRESRVDGFRIWNDCNERNE